MAHTTEQTLDIDTGSAMLPGDLHVPENAQGVVVFAHGSGSSRFSQRNRYVADALNDAGMATLLFDLLNEQEERVDVVTREFRFDIPLLGQRMVGALDWLSEQPETNALPVGLFGASTGAAAALIAAALRPNAVSAVVSRGGRPDLAGEMLPRVQAPTLLIVGERDESVIALNEEAMSQMDCHRRLEIVPRATHLFEEPGALEDVARLAGEFFQEQLGA